MSKNRRKTILAETYKDMQNLIAKAAWDFWNVYGGDFDDLMSQANLIFIDAFDVYDSSKAKLTTWLTIKIKKGLLDYRRSETPCRQKHIAIDDKFAEIFSTPKRDVSVMEFLDELNSDSLVVLQLFFETPKEIMVSIFDNSRRIDHARARVRRRLMNRLRQMGWTLKRIHKTFEEIKKVTSY